MDEFRGYEVKVPSWYELSGHALDRPFYERMRANSARFACAAKFLIPPRDARAFIVKRGQTLRVIEENGPQIGNVAFWNADNPRESFMAARFMSGEGFFVAPYRQLWSDVPWYRPLATCLDDTLQSMPAAGDYYYHLVGTPCSSEFLEMRFGVPRPDNCRENLVRAAEPLGVRESDLCDVVMVHQKSYLDPASGKILLARSGGKPGDYIEFYAEMDLIVGVSACPYGDGSGDPTAVRGDAVRPLRIEVYDSGVEPTKSPTWTDWRPRWTGRWRPPDEAGPSV
jgi:uncharacterized protein YcgI (DUF1989 family)